MQGFKFIVYFNTFATEDVDVFEELRTGGHLVRDRRGDPIVFQGVKFTDTGLADLYRAETRAFVKGEMERAVRIGADGWMADYGEWYPADPREVEPSGGIDSQEAHQRYPVEWARLNREVVADRDLVVFHRAGYSGAQGLAPVIWAGDQRTSFQDDDGLPTVVPILLGLGVTGFPIVTHDIGGYISSTNPPADKELFLRWTALGALAPVMRTHHGRDAAVNWRWSSDAETIAIFRRWAKLHTRWFPLWKGLAREASETGAPILRPLAFLDPSDRALHGVRDQYTIGATILVAPVVTASTTERSVRLAQGRWFAIEGDETFEGPKEISFPAPLGEAILLARAGTILPMLPEGVQTLAKSDALQDLDDVRYKRTIRIWLGANGEMREAEGGRYILESPSAPTPPLSEPPTKIAPNTTIQLQDAAGVKHIFKSEGVPEQMEIDLELRY